MRQFHSSIVVESKGRGLIDITREIEHWVSVQGMETGLLTLFIRHTSASLTIQENADPDVLLDLNDFFNQVVADNPKLYRHTAEGADDMPAHIRAALTATQLSIPMADGGLQLGTWQGIYMFEHRTRPHRRTIALHLLGNG